MTRPQLDTLEAKGLIRLAAYRPELEYLFRHSLVQDTAYGSLLKQERRDLHRRTGDALEALYPDRRTELAAVLAMHFEQAGETEKAIGYLLEAGRYGLERNALSESFAAFDRARELTGPATPADDPATRRRRIEIEAGRAQAGWSLRGSEEVTADLVAILPEAEALGDPELLVPIHLVLALNVLLSGGSVDQPAAATSLRRITELGEQTGDRTLRAMPLALAGLAKVFGGPIREGVAALEEAVPLLSERNQFIGAAFARGSLAIGYAELGEFEKADAAARDAVELSKQADLIGQLDAEIALAWVAAARGRLEEAAPLAQACVRRGEETGASACVMASSWVLGDILHRLGRFEEAATALRRGADIAEVVDRKNWRPTLRAWLASSMAALGNGSEADWDDNLATLRSIGNRVGEAGVLAKRGEARVRAGDVDAAVDDLRAAAAILEAEGARPLLARLLQTEGDALRRAGRASEAQGPLRRALALFEELGLEREAEGVRLALAAPSLELRA
jgi:tetratricopeptide (TPR) repeat protein